MSHQRPVAVCLMGPTATGKTDLALRLAADYPLEIVNVDSAQVYRGMDIGTAKPDEETRRRVPHHLVDIRDPAEPYSAAEFRTDALDAMAAIMARGRIPLLTGGTMLYFRALKEGLSGMPPADPVVRARIDALAASDGWAAIHARLAEVDPEAARRIHPNDPQRLQRALEIFEVTGQPMSRLHEEDAEACPYALIEIGIMPKDRESLHRRIAARFEAMLAEGLVDEVRALYRRGDLHEELPAIKAVGYRQVWQFLAGRIDHATMKARALAATRGLARRQLTWLRSWGDLLKIDGPQLDEVLKVLKSASILENF